MRPSKFIAYHERRLGRVLSANELTVIEAARAACTTGKRDTVKAMTAALEAALGLTVPARIAAI
jgi:hypothetical protein